MPPPEAAPPPPLLTRLLDPRLSTAASAIAFDLFLALVPVLALVGWWLGALGRTGQLEPIERALAEGVPGPAATIAREQLHRLSHAGGAVAPLALAGLLWSASGGAHTAIATVRSVSGAERWTWQKTRALALLFVLVGLLFVAAATTVLVVIEARAWSGALGPAGAAVGRAANAAGALVAATLGAAIFYRFARGSRRSSHVWPGAVVAVAALTGASLAFSWYATKLARYAAFYGGLAAVAMLLIWLWLSAYALLLGAEVNVSFDARTRARTPPPR